MPRRKWRQPIEEELAVHYRRHNCSAECAAKVKMDELFGVLTYNITDEVRANGKLVPDEEAVVKGDKLRSFIGLFLTKFSETLRNDELSQDELLWRLYSEDKKKFLGLVLGCLTDLCFSLEYIRRCSGEKWAYCTEHEKDRAFYSYQGVCPHCVIAKASPRDAALDIKAKKGGRYFGNKIESHYVGRIGERIITSIVDFLCYCEDASSESGLIIDDQHDVDAIFFVNGAGVLAQIKASPLSLIPLAASTMTRSAWRYSWHPERNSKGTFCGGATSIMLH